MRARARRRWMVPCASSSPAPAVRATSARCSPSPSAARAAGHDVLARRGRRALEELASPSGARLPARRDRRSARGSTHVRRMMSRPPVHRAHHDRDDRAVRRLARQGRAARHARAGRALAARPRRCARPAERASQSRPRPTACPSPASASRSRRPTEDWWLSIASARWTRCARRLGLPADPDAERARRAPVLTQVLAGCSTRTRASCRRSYAATASGAGRAARPLPRRLAGSAAAPLAACVASARRSRPTATSRACTGGDRRAGRRARCACW